MIWKQFLYNFMVLLNGPVKNALFCLMDRYRNVCVWFMARNCRLPKVGTHWLPTWEPAGYHCKELPVPRGWNVMVPNLGTRGYHCKQLPVPRGWNSCFPTWEPQVTSAKSFQFLKVGTDGSQRGNQRLPWQGTAGSQALKLTVPNLGTRGYHCKELPVPRS